MTTYFRTDTGNHLPGCPLERWESFLQELTVHDHLSLSTLAESAGYSLAMVVRFALGLSANEGCVTAFVVDSFAGYVTLAAARHLAVGGSRVHVIKAGNPNKDTPEIDHALTAIQRRGGTVRHWIGGADWESVRPAVENSHNVLCGLHGADSSIHAHCDTFVTEMNELATPVHTVIAPLGINLHTGDVQTQPLFASSTLSLGLPLLPLGTNESFVGRHYLGDLSWTKEMYELVGYSGHPLFHEQPVIKINTAPIVQPSHIENAL